MKERPPIFGNFGHCAQKSADAQTLTLDRDTFRDVVYEALKNAAPTMPVREREALVERAFHDAIYRQQRCDARRRGNG